MKGKIKKDYGCLGVFEFSSGCSVDEMDSIVFTCSVCLYPELTSSELTELINNERR